MLSHFHIPLIVGLGSYLRAILAAKCLLYQEGDGIGTATASLDHLKIPLGRWDSQATRSNRFLALLHNQSSWSKDPGFGIACPSISSGHFCNEAQISLRIWREDFSLAEGS